MKTKRLVSLLLSALLASSSLPMAMSAADAPAVDLSDVNVEIGEELLDDGFWAGLGSGHATVGDHEVAENKYLRINNSTANGAYYRIGETSASNTYAEGTYSLSFKARTQSDEAHVIRMKPNGGSQLYFTDGKKTISLDNDWETFTTQNFTTAAFKGIEIWGGPDGKYISPVEIDDFVITKYNADGGVERTWAYDFDTKAAAVFDTALENGIESESSYYSFSHAITNKDVAVYTPNDVAVLEPGIYQLSGEARMAHFYYQPEHSKYEYTDYYTGVTSVVYKGIEHSADCELCAPHKDGIGSYTSSDFAEIQSYIKTYKTANNALPIYHMDYLQHSYIDSTHGEAGVLAKDVNRENGDGIYHVLYKRIKTGIENDGNANYRGVAMNLNTSVYNKDTTDWNAAVNNPVAFDSNTSMWNDAGGFIDGSDNKILKVTDDWSTFSKTIRIDEYTKLNSIELGGTGYGYDIDPIDFRNVSLKQVDSFVLDEDEDVDENVTIMDIIEADIASTGETGLGTSPSFAAGNNYITAYDRANNNDGLWVAFNNLPEEPEGEEYKVQFDIRAAVPVYKNGYKNMNYRVYSVTATGGQKDAIISTPTPFYHGTWTTVSFNYDANIPYGFRIVGGGAIEAYNNSNTAPFEIDNLRIVDKDGNVVAGYLDTLDNASFTGEYYTTPVATYKKQVSYSAVPTAVKIALDTEEVFYNAKFDSAEGAISYTFEEDTVFEAGKYELTGELRAAEYNFNSSSTEDAKDDYLKFYPDTAAYNGKRAYIPEDNNAFDYSVVATFANEDGTTTDKEIGSGRATTGWSGFNAVMRIDEAAEIKSIKLVIKHALADTSVADVKLSADYKNFSIAFTPAEDQGEIKIVEFDATEFATATSSMTSVEADENEAGNNFLFVGDRRNNASGVKVTLKKYPTAEKVSFKIRLALPTADLNGAFGAHGGLRINYGGNIKFGTAKYLSYTGAWTEIEFDYDDSVRNNFVIYGNGKLSEKGLVNCAPFEIDDLKVLDAQGNPIVTETFDRVSEEGNKLVTKIATFETNDQITPHAVDLAIHTEEPYTSVSFPSAKDALVKDYIDMKLVPGLYTLTAELRNAEYIAKSSIIDYYPEQTSYLVRYPDSDEPEYVQGRPIMRVHLDNNGFEVAPVLYFDGAEGEIVEMLEPVSVNTTWTEIRYMFRVEEEITLDKIELGLTHLLGADSAAALKLDLKSVSLVCQPTSEKEEGIPNIGIIMVLLSKKAGGTAKLPAKGMTAAIADGTTELGEAVVAFDVANSARPAEAVTLEENNYMTMVGRINNGDGITIKDAGLNLDASRSYELKFDIRTSTDVTKIGSNPDNLTMSRIWVVGANQNINPTYGPVWTTVTIPYDAEKMAIGYSVVGGVGATFSHPYDIDNVRIVEAGTDTEVASVDFEDAAPTVVAETLSVNGFEFAYRYQYPAAENGTNAKIIVEKETSYAKATVTSTSRKAGTVSLAMDETVLNPGTYTLTLNARNGLYSGANTDIGKSNAVNFIMREPDDNTTKTRQRITVNNNYVNLYAEVVTDTTVFTAKANTTKVYCAWTPIEFTFGVSEPVTVKSVNVCASHALLNTNLAVADATVHVKDVAIYATGTEVIDIPVAGPETAEVEGNLIVNGDFDTAPTIIAGSTYDPTKANAWFQNDGEQYDTDANGKEMKEQGMIPFNHKITWNDGYITFSGRENNLRQFFYNAGVTVEAGASYKLTLDVKTANVGESSSIRVGVDGLFAPTAANAVSINNDWKTITVEFTASSEKPVKVFFYGGPGAGFTHDFCVDNVVLVKTA